VLKNHCEIHSSHVLTFKKTASELRRLTSRWQTSGTIQPPRSLPFQTAYRQQCLARCCQLQCWMSRAGRNCCSPTIVEPHCSPRLQASGSALSRHSSRFPVACAACTTDQHAAAFQDRICLTLHHEQTNDVNSNKQYIRCIYSSPRYRVWNLLIRPAANAQLALGVAPPHLHLTTIEQRNAVKPTLRTGRRVNSFESQTQVHFRLRRCGSCHVNTKGSPKR